MNCWCITNTDISETAHSSFENSPSERFWIGVNNILETGWINIDGSNANYFNWASGEPKNSTGTNGCVSVDLKGLWYNDECSTNYPFVCEAAEIETLSITTVKIEITKHFTIEAGLIR